MLDPREHLVEDIDATKGGFSPPNLKRIGYPCYNEHLQPHKK